MVAFVVVVDLYAYILHFYFSLSVVQRVFVMRDNCKEKIVQLKTVQQSNFFVISFKLGV